MKKVIALLLASIMVISMAACGSSGNETKEETKAPATDSKEAESEETEAPETTGEEGGNEGGTFALDGTWPAETVKIGVEAYDVTDGQFLAMQEYYESMKQYFNIEFMYSESIASAEDELKFIENCAAAGCKGFIGYYNVSGAEAVELCAQKGMYYWGGASKADIYDVVKTNEFYTGAYGGEDAEYEAGYLMAQTLIDQGCEKLVYVSGGDEMGIDFFIKRKEGFYDAVDKAKEEGKNVEVVYKVPGWPGTDAFTAEQTTVCDMEFDGLGCSFNAAPWFQPLANVDKLESIKIATIGVIDDLYKDLAAAGTISCVVYDCEEVNFGCAIPMLLNAITGHMDANRNEKGEAAAFAIEKWAVSDSATYDAIYGLHDSGEFFVTAEDIANCLVEYNSDASYNSLIETYSDLNLESALNKIK